MYIYYTHAYKMNKIDKSNRNISLVLFFYYSQHDFNRQEKKTLKKSSF